VKSSLKIVYIVIILCFALTVATGCATKQVKHSGFLENYPEFKPGPKGGADFVYMKEGVDFKRYNKIMMDHVVLYFKDDAKYKGIHPEELNEMSSVFHKAIADNLEGAYPLVDEPGSDVMRFRIAVTDVVASKPGMGTIATVMPIGLALSTIKKGVTGTHTGVGQASIEVEILDSMTNERIAVAIDTRLGGKIEGFTKWGAVKGAFEFWAKRLRHWLDETHGRKED
jgi:hypothetical protein